MDVDEIRSRIVAVRTWAVDHEEPEKALADELQLWTDVLKDIPAGAGNARELAEAALESLLVDYART